MVFTVSYLLSRQIFVYWWWNVGLCIHSGFYSITMEGWFFGCIYVIVMLVDMWAHRNLSDGAVHVFVSYLVFFVELTFLLIIPKVAA